MKLSMDTGCITEKLDNYTAIRMIKEAGFDALDWSFYSFISDEDDLLSGDYTAKAKKIREYMDSLGIVCNQAHAEMDFTHYDAMDISNDHYMRMVRSLEVSSILGAPNIVVHPVASAWVENIGYLEFSKKYIESLLPWCSKYGVCICIENMFGVKDRRIVGIDTYSTTDEQIAFVKSFDSEYVKACFDTGHCLVVGKEKPEDAIRKFSPDVLSCLHIHDNNGYTDGHTVPYLGNINWDNVASALVDIGYKGDFTLEASTFYYNMPTELFAPALRLAEATGRCIMKSISKEQGINTKEL